MGVLFPVSSVGPAGGKKGFPLEEKDALPMFQKSAVFPTFRHIDVSPGEGAGIFKKDASTRLSKLGKGI